jgi:hypothetical protein
MLMFFFQQDTPGIEKFEMSVKETEYYVSSARDGVPVSLASALLSKANLLGGSDTLELVDRTSWGSR